MKKGTVMHGKMFDLAARMEASAVAPDWQAEAIGLLTKLWEWAGDFAPRGDVGRFPDVAIAKAVGWQGKPGALIQMLVEAGWLDEDAQHRLVIHDWAQHCEERVRKKVRAMDSEFVGKTPANSGQVAEDGAPPREHVATNSRRPRENSRPTNTNTLTKEEKPIESLEELGDHGAGAIGGLASERDGQPEAAGAIVARLVEAHQPQVTLSQVVGRVLALTGQGGGWGAWWGDMVKALARKGGLGAFLQQLAYAEDCMDAAVRQAKDLGELKDPARWLVKAAQEAAMACGARWASYPDAAPPAVQRGMARV